MKKMNKNGFVLAETLVVTVFLMVLFALIYSNFYPIMGEYEKREVYDDVDGKYAVYWLKLMQESEAYNALGEPGRDYNFNTYGYVRFQCSDIDEIDSKTICKDLVQALNISGCDGNGNDCDVFITRYRIGNSSDTSNVWFKDTVKENLKRWQEGCTQSETVCKQNYVNTCVAGGLKISKCQEQANEKVFSNGFKEYIASLPDYTFESLNYAPYRVIVAFHHTEDNNNYYSYANIEAGG